MNLNPIDWKHRALGLSFGLGFWAGLLGIAWLSGHHFLNRSGSVSALLCFLGLYALAGREYGRRAKAYRATLTSEEITVIEERQRLAMHRLKRPAFLYLVWLPIALMLQIPELRGFSRAAAIGMVSLEVVFATGVIYYFVRFRRSLKRLDGKYVESADPVVYAVRVQIMRRDRLWMVVRNCLVPVVLVVAIITPGVSVTSRMIAGILIILVLLFIWYRWQKMAKNIDRAKGKPERLNY